MPRWQEEFDSEGVDRAFLLNGAVRRFHLRLMILFPFGEHAVRKGNVNGPTADCLL